MPPQPGERYFSDTMFHLIWYSGCDRSGGTPPPPPPNCELKQRSQWRRQLEIRPHWKGNLANTVDISKPTKHSVNTVKLLIVKQLNIWWSTDKAYKREEQMWRLIESTVCTQRYSNLMKYNQKNWFSFSTKLDFRVQIVFSFRKQLPLMVQLVRFCQTWSENFRPMKSFLARFEALVFAGDFRSRLFSWAEMRGGGVANLKRKDPPFSKFVLSDFQTRHFL